MEYIKNRIAIVVLNYLNYQDTIECVNSILKNNYQVVGVVVVDNCSTNGSYKRIKSAFKNNTIVHVIQTKKNLGFAKGNNIGICYARKKLNARAVLVVNNDTVFTDNNYIDILWQKYKPGVGIIGSKIILKNNKEQPIINDYIGLKDTFFAFINAWTLDRGSSFDFPIRQGKSTQVLHGCALLFTPDYFEYYDGFYKRTFLYGEEPILYLMCQCKNLCQVYTPNTSIYHKEDQSSEMSFHNDNNIKKKYMRQSSKYIFWWSLKYTLKSLVH